MCTAGRHEQQFGVVEVRHQPHTNGAAFPAVWEAPGYDANYAAANENDIYEYLGPVTVNGGIVTITHHWNTYANTQEKIKVNTGIKASTSMNVVSSVHVPSALPYYFNGKRIGPVIDLAGTNMDQHTQKIPINLAIGASFIGAPSAGAIDGTHIYDIDRATALQFSA